MKIRNLILVATLLSLFNPLKSFSQLTEHKGLRFFVIRSAYNNLKLPENNGESHFSIGIDVVKSTFEKGKIQFAYRNTFISDGIVEVAKLIRGESGETPGETFIYSLLPGWFQLGWNIIGNEKFNIAPGLFAGDYWYAAVAPYSNTVPGVRGHIEPAGWYGAAGPAVFVDVALSDSMPLVLHLESSYSLSMRWSESRKVREEENFNPDSPDPHFFNNRIELRYNSFFLGYRLVKMINKYEVTKEYNSGSRSDVFLGIKF